MKRALLIAAGILFLLAIAGVAAFLVTPRSAPDRPGGSTVFPSSGDSGAEQGSEAITVRGQQGNPITVRNFIENGETSADPANEGRYIVAGETGYCEPGRQCAGGAPSDEFSIIYEEADDSFIVALRAEPLSSARFAAESLLKETLGLSEEAMCALNYAVLVDAYVNEQYAGENLGFSFCPGAAKLP